jgi:hypothetical protein
MPSKSQRQRIIAAATLFSDFTGDEANTVESFEIPSDDTLMVVGICEAIAYNAIRDGKRQSYQHEFARTARPVLAVSSDGRRLYLLAGAYRFTSHGIEDHK